MNRLSFFPKMMSGFIEIPNALLISPYISNSVLPIFGNVDIGSSSKPFHNIHANDVRGVNLWNMWGSMNVNNISANVPLSSVNNAGTSTITLNIDENTLQIVEGKLSVKTSILNSDDISVSYTTPLSMNLQNATTGVVSLNYNIGDFNITEGKLSLPNDFLKSRGCLHSYNKLTEFAGEIGDYFENIIPDSWDVNARFILMKTSSEFEQVGGKLQLKSPGGSRIPFFSSTSLEGLQSDSTFTYTGGVCHANKFKTNVNFNLSNEDVPSVQYLFQAYQSAENSAIDVLDRQGSESRRNLQVRKDDITIGIDSSNKLYSKVTYSLPIKQTNTSNSSTVSLEVDGSSIKILDGKLSFGLSGSGIVIDKTTSSMKLDISESLRFEGNKVSMNIGVSNPLVIANGKDLSLKINPDTMLITGDGALSARQVLVDNQTIGWTSDSKLKGLYTAGQYIEITDYNKIGCTINTEYPLKLETNGKIKLYYDDTLSTDGAGNLSVKPVLVDNYTIIRRNNELYTDNALKVNLFGENGVSVVGNKIRGSYLAGTRISISSGSTISCTVQDIEESVAKNAADLITEAAVLGSGLAAASAAAATGIVLANSAIAASAVNSGLIGGLTSALGITDAVVSALGLQNQVNTGAIASLAASTSAGIASASAVLEAQIIANALVSTTAITGLTSAVTLVTSGLAGAISNITILDGLVSGILGVQGTILGVQASHTATLGSLLADAITQASILTGAVSTGIANSSAIVGLTTNVGILDTSVGLNTSAIAANSSAIGSLIGTVSGLSVSTAASISALSASIAGTDFTVAGLSLGAIGTAISLASLGGRCSSLESDLSDIEDTVDEINIWVQDRIAYLNTDPYMKRQVDSTITSSEGKSRMLFISGGATYHYGEHFWQNTANSANLLTMTDSASTFNTNVYIGSERVSTREWVIGQGYITGSALTPYVLTNSLTSTLGSYVTNTSLTSTLGSYVTNSSLTTTLGSYMQLKPASITSSQNHLKFYFDNNSTYVYGGSTFFQSSDNNSELMRVQDSGVNINVPLHVQGNIIATQSFVNGSFLPVDKMVVSSKIQYTMAGSLTIFPNDATTSCSLNFSSNITGYYKASLYVTSLGEFAFKLGNSAPSWRVNQPSGQLICDSGLRVNNAFQAVTTHITEDSIQINKENFNSVDRTSCIDFYSHGNDYSSRIVREPGVAGTWRFLNSGEGFVEFDNPSEIDRMFYFDIAQDGFLDHCWMGHFRFRQSTVFESCVAITGVKQFDPSTTQQFANPVWFGSDSNSPPNGVYSLMLTGSILTNGSLMTLSDRRVKKDIKVIPEKVGLDIVEKLQAVTFSYKKDNRKSLGFVAQEVLELLPSCVSQTNERMFLDYQQMVAVLWSAVSDLTKEVRDLKNKLKGKY